jgi:hypothetical protein
MILHVQSGAAPASRRYLVLSEALQHTKMQRQDKRKKELPWIPDAWKNYPPSIGKKPRTTPAPVSTIIIQKPKTARQKREAQLRMSEGQLPALPDFIQVRRKQPKTFRAQVKRKRANARDLAKKVELSAEVRELEKDVIKFDQKIFQQKQKLRDVWVPAQSVGSKNGVH